jgi:hypothetical protein
MNGNDLQVSMDKNVSQIFSLNENFHIISGLCHSSRQWMFEVLSGLSGYYDI